MEKVKRCCTAAAAVLCLMSAGCGKQTPARDTSHDTEDAKQAVYDYVACTSAQQLTECVYEADLAAKLLENRALDGLLFAPGAVLPENVEFLSVEELPKAQYATFQTVFAFAAAAAGVADVRPFTIDAGYEMEVRGICEDEEYCFQITDKMDVIHIVGEGWRIGQIHCGNTGDIQVLRSPEY